MPESTFRELADNAPVMIWRAGVDKLCDWFNKPWLDFVGRTMEQEQGYGWADGVHPDDYERCVAIYTTAFDARETFSMTYRLRRHDGQYRWLLDNGAPFSRDGAFAGYFGSCLDVTEQREAHDQAVAALEQRDVMISEVYHRVKNNLQQIEGLIAIETLQLGDVPATAALNSISARVRAMGAVHQLLIRSPDLSHIRADEFLINLCTDIARANNVQKRDLALKVEAEPRLVDIDRSLIIGLLVNELVSNAFKHAFPEGRGGGVIVRFCARDREHDALEVIDNGIGLAGDEPGAIPSRGSGFRLIEGFVDQLDGRLSIERKDGTTVRIIMPTRRGNGDG
jgi:PAS domain S-box-containing protein